ncbi:protein-L-isoaspartate O-methyltransferase [Candidatus Parcubacteria bacterium]|nr:protein-L-isoaspartate O-methyltransferase [Candidatus Parcubacteria bacterium]
MQEKEELLNHLEFASNVFQNPAIKDAFHAIDRADFVTDDYKVEAYEDYPLPIGEGQTISQPTTVAFMLEKLDPKPGDKILDIGSGSGWTTALLAHIVGVKGHVSGLEIVPTLAKFGQDNLSKYGFKNADITDTSKTKGKLPKGLYDKIMVNAYAEELPEEYTAHLKVGGTMVIPIGMTMTVIEKISDTEADVREYPGFVFVPLQ